MASIGSQNVVSWQPHGKAFRVHQPAIFARAIMPRYFKQTKYKSFQRQLHIYGFHRINKGMDKGAYFHCFFVQNKKEMSLQMTRRDKSKGTAGKKNHDHQHEIEVPNFYEEMVVMKNCLPHYNDYNQTNRNLTTMAKPVPIMPGFSGVTAKNTFRSGVGGRLDFSSMDMTEQNVSSSSFKKNNSLCNSQFTNGNIASVVMKEHIEDGDEVFFEGKKFYFVETSVPTPAPENFLASVTARGPIAYMPKCA
jgi:hypothetical protein